MVIDSGAAASVLPEKWCSHVRTMSTEASRKGEHHTAANGGKKYQRREDGDQDEQRRALEKHAIHVM